MLKVKNIGAVLLMLGTLVVGQNVLADGDGNGYDCHFGICGGSLHQTMGDSNMRVLSKLVYVDGTQSDWKIPAPKGRG